MGTLLPLRRFLSKGRLAFTITLMLIAALLDGISVGLVLPLLTLLSGGAPADEHRWIGTLAAGLNRIGIGFTLVSVLGMLGGVTLVRTIIRYIADLESVKLVEQMIVTVRVKAAENLLAVSPAFYANVKTGDLTQTILDEVEKTGLAVMYFLKTIAQGAIIVVWVAAMALFSWKLTVASVAVAALMTLIVRFRFGSSKRFGQEIADAKQALSSRVIEMLAGLRVIWLTVSEKAEIARLRKGAAEVGAAALRFHRNTGIVNVIGENLATIAMLVIVYWSVAVVRTDMATLVAFFFVFSRVLPQVHRVNVVRTELKGFAAHAANVLRLLERTGKPVLAEGSRTPTLKRAIEFRSVSFEYRPGEPVLRDVTIEIPAGKTVAVAGASGAGKSTLIELLGRFYDPTAGEILIDGVPLREIDRAAWRRRLGVVSQDVFLFHDSIRNNIAFGSGAIEPAAIEAAARMANAHDFISELPDGYETRVGDRGLTLSGGQRQRIALARALVTNPDLLVLDEATSALDAEAERLILDAIHRLSGTLTILVIGHRLATLRNADRIYVVEGGAIVESGTHAALLAAGGRYAHYCQLQRI